MTTTRPNATTDQLWVYIGPYRDLSRFEREDPARLGRVLSASQVDRGGLRGRTNPVELVIRDNYDLTHYDRQALEEYDHYKLLRS